MSACALVNPHATKVLLPATSVGWPGSVMPSSRRVCDESASSRHSSTARYHVFGTRMSRCMSLATSARPSEVSSRDTAQLLLPSAASPGVDAHGFGALFGGDLATVLQVDLGASVALAPQVVDVRPRHVGGGKGLADHRRIPLGAARREQVEHLGRQHVVHRRQHRLVGTRSGPAASRTSTARRAGCLRPPTVAASAAG